jgi:hypothetical protein
MKKFRINMFLLFLLITGSSFNTDKTLKSMILGSWIRCDYDHRNRITVYKRNGTTDKKGPGLRFRKNGILVARANTSWCGTPPVDYRNFTGSWSIRDSVLTYRYRSWHVFRDTIRILTINDTLLKTQELR